MQNTVFWLRAAESCATAVAAASKDPWLISLRAQAELLLGGTDPDSIYPERAGECWTSTTEAADRAVARRGGLCEIVRAPAGGGGIPETVWLRLARGVGERLQNRFEEMLDDAVRGLRDWRVYPATLDLAAEIAGRAVRETEPRRAELIEMLLRGAEITRGTLDPSHLAESTNCNAVCVLLDRAGRGEMPVLQALGEAERLFTELTAKGVSGELLGASPVLCDALARLARRSKRLAD